jgi:predicted HD superfamily hydrolase involved in NAD metabolism
MDKTKALELVRQQLPEKRYIHTLGVVQSAKELARRYGVDEDKAELAAIYHDYAKYRPLDEMEQIIKDHGLPADLLTANTELWHAPVGAILVQMEAGVEDEEVLSAIRYHTSGRARMTELEKVIYLADYIEPGRSFPGVDEVRDIAARNLDEAVMKAIGNTIAFLISKQQTIYPDTFHAYNGFAMHKGGHKNE